MIQVLFFAEMQEKVGQSEITIEDSDITVMDLKDNYLKKYNMDGLIDQAMLAVNEEYAEETLMLKSGDVVAFIPPVSGG